ncbi:error-prone DNA polymerase [Sulfuritalea sp.]|uniref:error-prone DNA polymerase n=1 Tax=Sulfuritalea sp. TaxID=2480090 RepID=UPI001ACC3560|nr:error-prone DNA polymerase [Sulfuritalea sp.]MBN8477221.1 error-prone DNA polymerase [Sulfuritalea sp.]
MSSLPAYAELHCLSSFSFLRGASQAEELVARAQRLGYAALAITDECSFAGSVRAHLAARDKPIKLIHGTELVLACGMKLVLLACNRAGYGNLAALVTLGRRRAEKGSYRLSRADIAGWDGGGVPDCLALWVPGVMPPAEPEAVSLADGAGDVAKEVPLVDTVIWHEQARWLAERFAGRAWIAFERHLRPDDGERLAHLRALAASLRLPLVAAGDVHMHVRSRRPLQDALTALRLNTTVAAAGHALFPNGERHLRQRLALARLYPTELLAETLKVAALCNFSLVELRYEYPEEVVPAGQTPDSWLRQLSEEGLARRYPAGVPDKVVVQVEHELALIAEMAYAPYFLTVHDIVAWARGQGILCQGRGSAANSAVCYALFVTEVDPARASMLFERFVSKERNEPPDIDVDFEHQRREEVIQYIYARYGRERAALAAAVITYRTRGALRDAGRALGFPLAAIERLAGNLAWWDRREELAQRFAEVGLDPEHPAVQRWLGIAKMLIGLPRHLTQHVGGFVISRGRLDRLVPVENAAMPERTVIQWDKDDIDALGLMKVDVLALGMLSAIRRMLAAVAWRHGTPFGLASVPAEDAATYEMVSRADTVGVFQIESRAQMAMLPRLRPACFYDLVIEVALVRPGPIQGNMVHPYLRRRQGQEPVEYPGEAVREVLSRTLGVPIFQEQAMQLAIVAAGFTPGEADRLRRAMAAWKRKGGLEPFRERLLSGMRERGYADEFAEALYRQIQGFGEYGFPESHAASFALLVYVSAWLKRHEPAAFLLGLLNSQPMGFYSPAQLVQDARRHGVDVRPVDVTASDWESTLEGDGGAGQAVAVRLGLHQVRHFAAAAGARIVAARAVAPFSDLADLARRAELGGGELDALADAGALAHLAGHRRQAAWVAAAVPLQRDLFAGVAPGEARVEFAAPREGEDIVADYRSLGLTLGRHPLALLRARLVARRYLSAMELRERGDRAVVRCAGIVTCRQRPGTASGVIFVTLEDETGSANIVVFNDLACRQRRLLLGSRLLGVAGQLQVEGEGEHAVVHLVARRLFDHSELLGALVAGSRDFH